jgi:hypothetical protein
MFGMKLLSLFTSVSILSACGTYTPGFQEFPFSSADEILLVNAINTSIECELRRATVVVIERDKAVAKLNGGLRSAPWIEFWGVEVSTSLNATESSGVTPSVRAGLPSTAAPDVSLVGTIPISVSASRTGKMQYFYQLSDLYKSGRCSQDIKVDLPSGSLLIRNDLKIAEWLLAHSLSAGTGAIPLSTQPKALTHSVEFVLTTNGTLTASWPGISSRLSAFGIGGSAGRVRRHSVTMTFGLSDPAKRSLSGSAADTFLAAQIGAEIRNSGIR